MVGTLSLSSVKKAATRKKTVQKKPGAKPTQHEPTAATRSRQSRSSENRRSTKPTATDTTTKGAAMPSRISSKVHVTTEVVRVHAGMAHKIGNTAIVRCCERRLRVCMTTNDGHVEV